MQLAVLKTKLSRDRSFAKMVPVLWINIPANVRMATSIDEFKGLLKTSVSGVLQNIFYVSFERQCHVHVLLNIYGTSTI